jgi:putative DNA primase/helicase
MIDKKQILGNVNIVDLIGKFQHLKKKGSEFYGNCPFHDDKKDSLQVSERKQIYKCFACGSGGDAVNYLMGAKNMTFIEACNEIDSQPAPTNKPIVQAKKTEWTQIKPQVLAGHIKHYNPEYPAPTTIFTYFDENTIPIGYVVRFDFPDGKKQTLPYVYATNGVRSEWRWMGFGKPRPIYNQDKLHAFPDSWVIICEGEKTAVAIDKEINVRQAVVTTWIGGANSIKETDWSKLDGRKIIFWPDNDEPGYNAMVEISKLIKYQQARFVYNPENLPKKWDAADKKWNYNELNEFIQKYAGDVPEYEIEIPLFPEIIIPDILDEKVKPTYENPYFRFLGYDKDDSGKLVYFFFAFQANMVVKLAPTSMSKANLFILAPVNFWEMNFPSNGKEKFNNDSIVQFLIDHSHEVGVFKESLIRGRGAWMDSGKILFHTGENLIIDNEVQDLKKYRSRYVYEISEPLKVHMRRPLTNQQSKPIIEMLNWLTWERPINSYFLAGWCVLAPFCGVLDWRPHVWITGPSGSGKSWVMENVVKRLTGETGVVVQGKTTEAAIRGILQSDALPIMFDEGDVDTIADKDRIQSIINFARSSSSKNGGKIVKGTAGGGSRSFTARSMMAMASIGVHLSHRADQSRFSILSLMKARGEKQKEAFKEWGAKWLELTTENYIDALHARTLRLMKTILKNSAIFSDAVTAHIGERRIGDQVGVLLAGAWSLHSEELVTFQQALNWVAKKQWNEEKSLDSIKDEQRLFSKLMAVSVKVESNAGTVERTIGELCLITIGSVSEKFIFSTDADNRLRRLGIIATSKYIYFANNSDGIHKLIHDTPWKDNYNLVLQRIDGATKTDSRYYNPGLTQRGTGIPTNLIIKSNEDVLRDLYTDEFI